MRTLTILAFLACPTLASAQEITPLDGTWTITPRENSVGDGCPEEMTGALDNMVEQASQAASIDVAWNGTFDPSAADIEGGNEGVEWTEVDDRTWDGEMKVTPDAPTLGTLRMHITEPGRIESTTTLAVGRLMEAQGEEVAGMENCEVEIKSDMTHAG